MKLLIRSICISPAADIRAWEPIDRKVVNKIVRINIGTSEKKGTDDFFLRISTPAGLEEMEVSNGIIASSPLLVLKEYDGQIVWDWIHSKVRKCEEDSWSRCVERLCRYFDWEYDDYKAS